MGKRWQDAWMLVKTDLSRFKLGTLFTFIFSAYMSLCTMFAVQSVVSGESVSKLSFIFLDFMMLIIVSNLGCVFNRRAFRYWSEDSYRKYLLKVRSLPIDLHSIVLSRYISMGIFTLINSFVFFTIQYFAISSLRDGLSLSQFLAYVFVAIVYSVMMHSFFVVLEWSYSGKKYFVFVMAIIITILLVTIGIGLTGNSVFLTLIYAVRHWPLITTIIAFVLLTQIIPFGMRMSLHTLRKVDLM
ncbi:hypothetical protein [Paenibacillus marinisediminis]